MRTLDEIQENFPRQPTKRYRNKILKPALSSADCFNASFLSSRDNPHEVCGGPGWHGCDMQKAVKFFDFLQNKCRQNRDLDRTVKEALQELMSNLPKKPACKEELRLYLILPACHLMTDCKMHDSITCPFAISVKNLDEHYQQIIDEWLKAIPLKHFRRLVVIFRDAFRQLGPKWIKYIGKSLTLFTNLESCLFLMDKLYKVNEMRDDNLCAMAFYVPELSAHSQLITDDFILYLNERKLNQTKFRLCKFPFLFNEEIKHCLLQIYNRIEMSAGGTSDQQRPNDMVVDRRNIVEDTKRQLQYLQSIDENMHKRELKVLFKGEDDYGPGVYREFFTLIFQRLLSPSLNLFTYLDEDAPNYVWFHQEQDSDLHDFHFAGFMLGLALYNSQVISLPFPLALFKKLLGVPIDFSDLREIRPNVAKNLIPVLETTEAEDFESLELTFEVTQRKNGKNVDLELCENGKNISVAQDNKIDYVRLMVDFYLNKDKDEEFQHFYKGFYQAFDSEILKILKFQPSELHSILIGHERIDTALLEKNAVYEGGYNHNHPTIRIFWDIIHSLSEQDKRNFLKFVTGSERVPHSGLKIWIRPRPASVGENIEDVIPEAFTCFQKLFLPDNPDKERLHERLLVAFEENPEFTSTAELLRRMQISE